MLMKNTIISGLLMLPLAVLADNTSFIDEQTYDLSDINELSLSLRHANIKISHDKRADHLSLVHQQVLKKGDAEKCLYRLVEKRRNNSLSLYNEKKSDGRGFFNFSFSGGCSVEQDITIFIGSNLLESFSGEFQHSNIELDQSKSAALSLDIAHSKMTINNLSSATSQLHLAHSYLAVTHIIAQDINITGAHSSFDVTQLKAVTLDGDWAHGAINIEQSNIANMAVTSAHGSINLTAHQGENLTLDAAHSRIFVDTTITEQAELENRHGPIEFIGMAKKLSVTNAHGEINITQLSDAFDISGHNQHGDILLSLPKNSDYHYQLNSHEVLIEPGNMSNNQVTLTTSHGRAKITEH